ncbi:MAG: sensor histidine kinase [Cyanobacteria bacterium J06621_11]
MESAVPIAPKLKKILRWIEWALIFDSVVTNTLRVDLSVLPFAHLRIIVGLSALAAFSLILLPTHFALNQRRLYIFFGFLLLILLDIAKINYSAINDLLIIKACLLLPRKDAIVATVTMVTINFSQWALFLPSTLENVRELGVEPFLNRQNIIMDAMVGTIAGTFFVLLLGFVFVAEQRSRHRAEKLALEVESLATKLERSRIARDIHDSLGHTLTTLDVQLALVDRYAQATLENQFSPKLQQAIKQSQQLAAQCLAEARESVKTIRAANFNLEAALQSLSTDMQKSFQLDLQVLLPPLPQQLSYQLFLIAKEGLINVQKHAQATVATLSLKIENEQILLFLTDDGCGFDPKINVTGYGLQGIKERSQLLGGKFTLYTQPNEGTQLQVSVPRRITGESD